MGEGIQQFGSSDKGGLLANVSLREGVMSNLFDDIQSMSQQEIEEADGLQRFKKAVADICPFLPGESFDLYCLRVSLNLKPGQRAMLAVRLRDISKEITKEKQAKKDAWIALARRSFRPARPAPCQVCGKYRDLAQAHHLVPLALQYDRGFRRIDHDHVWLCPTHHAAIHALIGRTDDAHTDEDLQKRGRRALDGIVDMELEELDVLLDLLGMAGWGMAPRS